MPSLELVTMPARDDPFDYGDDVVFLINLATGGVVQNPIHVLFLNANLMTSNRQCGQYLVSNATSWR